MEDIENKNINILNKRQCLPIIIRFGAQTSTVSFIQAFMTQWYSKEEQLCFLSEHFFLFAASFHSLAVLGQKVTGTAVAIDSEHPSAFTCIC